jgi:hypothetical protein
MKNPIIEISDNVELFDRESLLKSEKSYNVGSGTKVTTAYPVFINNKKISKDEFSYLPGDAVSSNQGQEVGITSGGGSNITWNTGKTPTLPVTPTKSTATTIFDSPAYQPTIQEEVDKAKKEGKFWDKKSKSWQKFKNSPGGQFALQQTLNYLQQRLIGEQSTGGYTDNTPPPPEKDNTVWYILGGVAIIGILALVLTQRNKPATA